MVSGNNAFKEFLCEGEQRIGEELEGAVRSRVFCFVF